MTSSPIDPPPTPPDPGTPAPEPETPAPEEAAPETPAPMTGEPETLAVGPVDGPGQRRRAGRIVGIAVGAALVALGAAYAVGYALAGDRLPKHATVEGVAVGGLDPAAATETLRTALRPRATAPIRLEIAGEKAELEPAAAGLAIDYPASVAAAGGARSLDPRTIYRVLTGGSETPAIRIVDDAALAAAVGKLAADHDRAPENATLAYEGRTVVTEDGKQGVSVDADGAAAAIVDAYPSAAVVPVPATVTDPEITTAAVAAAVRDLARPAVAAPIAVRAGGAGSFEIGPSVIASALSFEPTDGALAPVLNAKRLRKALDDDIARLRLSDHRNATVRLVKGKPTVIPSSDGTDIAAPDLAAAVRPALSKPKGERTVSVKLSGAPAEFSTDDARKLKIAEVTGQFTTYFPYAYYRNVNIARAAEKIDGTVLKPGETFSLNKIVGERTKANGFVEGYIISGGKFKKELGGGVSQSATTTFNAMFFAGLQDVRHQPHTLYIDRYPAGREATVAWPNLDLRFRNNTDYGVLVQAYVKKGTPSRKGSITVKMWSTKTWDKVSSSALVRSNYTTGRDLTDRSASCEPQAPVQGFTVSYSRLFYRDGTVVRREPFRWTYAPTDRIICR